MSIFISAFDTEFNNSPYVSCESDGYSDECSERSSDEYFEVYSEGENSEGENSEMSEMTEEFSSSNSDSDNNHSNAGEKGNKYLEPRSSSFVSDEEIEKKSDNESKSGGAPEGWYNRYPLNYYNVLVGILPYPEMGFEPHYRKDEEVNEDASLSSVGSASSSNGEDEGNFWDFCDQQLETHSASSASSATYRRDDDEDISFSSDFGSSSSSDDEGYKSDREVDDDEFSVDDYNQEIERIRSPRYYEDEEYEEYLDAYEKEENSEEIFDSEDSIESEESSDSKDSIESEESSDFEDFNESEEPSDSDDFDEIEESSGSEDSDGSEGSPDSEDFDVISSEYSDEDYDPYGYSSEYGDEYEGNLYNDYYYDMFDCY